MSTQLIVSEDQMEALKRAGITPHELLAMIPGSAAPPAPFHQANIPAVFDPARFQAIGAVADVMADSSLCPDHLTGYFEGDGAAKKFVTYPLKQIRANCFLITNQAFNWKVDPFMLAQATSIVHGRLMFEGKAVAGAIDANLGIRLRYTYQGEGLAMVVTVSGQYPGETEPRTITGSVEQWRTTGNNSPWGAPKNFPRQLAYRGAREWARIHAPALMLGVVTDDEDLEADRRPEPIAPASAPPIAIQTGFKPPPKKSRAKTATEKPAEAQDSPQTPAEAAGEGEQDQSPEDTTTGEEATSEAEQQTTGEAMAAGEDETTEQRANRQWAERLHVATSWADLQAAMGAFAQEIAGPMTAAQSSAIRRGTWLRLEELMKQTGEVIAPEDDPTLFACFIYGCDDPDRLTDTFNQLQLGESFARLKSETRTALKKAALDRIAQCQQVRA